MFVAFSHIYFDPLHIWIYFDPLPIASAGIINGLVVITFTDKMPPETACELSLSEKLGSISLQLSGIQP